MQDWMPGTAGPRPAPAAAAWSPLEVPPDLARAGLFVGTSGFHYEDWAGAFYPPRGSRNGGVPGAGGERPAGGAREWYPFYQMYFSFLEVNHTFLREPDLAHFAELERRSRPSMRFSVMAHRDVSQKGTWDSGEGRSLMRKHVAAVAPLAESGRFHSFLIQLDHRQERSRRVHDYLLATASAAVEEGLDAHVEFRNRTWHQEAVLRSLQDAGIGVCNPDLPALLPGGYPLRAYATTAKGYVRYSGQNAAAWDAAARDASARDAGAAPRRASFPAPEPQGIARRDSRYEYLYSLEEVEARIPGQLELLRKTGAVAVVYRNHVRGGAALNAVQNLFLAERRLGGGGAAPGR